jgi:hypothetical protein
MTQQYTPNLGNLPDDDARRDAVHIAVAPVVAGSRLQPGRRVGLASDGRAYSVQVEQIGVVDPFLTEPVEAGQRFWLFLYPNTVTSLRHVWTHPAFTVKEPKP